MTTPAFVLTVRSMTNSTRGNDRSLASLEARLYALEQNVLALQRVFNTPDMMEAHAQVHKHLMCITADTLANLRVIQTRGFQVIERANAVPAGPPKDPMEKMMEMGQVMMAAAQAMDANAPQE